MGLPAGGFLAGLPECWVDLDGRLLPAAEATISVFNHGFLFGDSVYEVLRTYGGRPSLVGPHLDRLERSARALRLEIPLSREAIVERIERIVARAGFPESYIRLIVTRGTGLPNIDPRLAGPPEVLVLVLPLRVPALELYESGVPVALVSVRRAAGADVKSGNYLNSVLALMEATSGGAYEGIMRNDQGDLTEASTSNVFLGAGGRLVTPALGSGILQGITRGILLALAAELGIPAEERMVRPEELRQADEAFLSSTLREVLPISSVDDCRLPECPGPLSRRLLAAYREQLARGV